MIKILAIGGIALALLGCGGAASPTNQTEVLPSGQQRRDFEQLAQEVLREPAVRSFDVLSDRWMVEPSINNARARRIDELSRRLGVYGLESYPWDQPSGVSFRFGPPRAGGDDRIYLRYDPSRANRSGRCTADGIWCLVRAM